MATEMVPGVFTALFAELAAQVEVKTRVALEGAALEVERQAKLNASHGQHVLRTKTPATPGSGPAQISGTLVRSIGSTTVERSGSGWQIRVGPASGMFPSYNHRTDSATYARYLEVVGVRSGARYPFLVPALESVGRVKAQGIFLAAFGSGWIVAIG